MKKKGRKDRRNKHEGNLVENPVRVKDKNRPGVVDEKKNNRI